MYFVFYNKSLKSYQKSIQIYLFDNPWLFPEQKEVETNMIQFLDNYKMFIHIT